MANDHIGFNGVDFCKAKIKLQTPFTLQITHRQHFNVIKGKALFSFSDYRFDFILSHKIAVLITGQLPC